MAPSHEEDLTMLIHNPFSHLERSEVPRLPIPPLPQTLQRYLEGVRPLLTPEAFQATTEHVRAFEKEQGPSLDRELRQLAEESPTSWLEGFWDTGYLEYRVPVPIHVNPFFVIHPTPSMNPYDRAAEVVTSSIRLWESIKSGALPVEKSRGEVQCMTSYWRVFGTARIPKPSRDQLATCPTSRHILVISRNWFYPLTVYDASHKPRSASSIAEDLHRIQEDSQAREIACSVGVLTAENRDAWATARNALQQGNADNLRMIDSAIMVVCLEQENPRDAHHLSQIMLHGTGENRWFDKLQLIVCPDGSAAWNMEHAPHDGHTLLICSTYIYDDILGTRLIPGAGEKTTLKSSSPSSLIPLQWDLSEEVIQAIGAAKETITTLLSTTQSRVLNFTAFGSNTIKGLKISPDAFVQMAYQLAYYRISGQAESTYESCNMKGFYHGRTETIRSVSMESKAMCESFFKPAVSASMKEQLIRQAAKRHSQTGLAAKQGNGVDRHLLGLQQLARHRQVRLPLYDIPAIFQDPAYGRYCGSVLSTSNCGGYALDLFGFGPVMPQGLGIGYIIKDDELLFNITSFIGQADVFAKALQVTLMDMLELCGSQPISKL